MNKVKLALVTLSIMILPMAALAINNPINNVTGVQVSTLDVLVNTVLGKIWIVFAAIAVVAFLTAGILFLTANGSADKIATARQAFLWGVVGVVVGIIAYSIISIVGSLIQ